MPMNFQEIPPVEKAETYLDFAFRTVKRKKGEPHRRVAVFAGDLTKRLQKIESQYPSMDSLTPFYSELFKATLDMDRLRKSLSSVKWARRKIEQLGSKYEGSIAGDSDAETSKKHQTLKQFYARASSIMHQIDDALSHLEEARRIMRRYPAIKQDVFTVAVFGFPNIGKTTLLSHITAADPEINEYSFTTKAINVGYIKNPQTHKRKVQVLDTPGSLNRFDKMNQIEKQADIVISHAANLVVYVFDLTEPYPMADQEALYEKIRASSTPVLIYLSKADALAEDSVTTFKKERSETVYTDPDAIYSFLVKKADEREDARRDTNEKEEAADQETS